MKMRDKVHAKHHQKRDFYILITFAVFTIKVFFRNAALNTINRMVIDLGNGYGYPVFYVCLTFIIYPSNFPMLKF